MGAQILAGLLALLALYFVLRPLTRRQAWPGETSQLPADALLREKEGVLLAITELEFDHKTGVVSDEDYGRFMARYRAHAMALMQEIDRLRAAAPSAGLDADTAEKDQARKCSSCGRSLDKAHRFCTSCGHTQTAVLTLLIVLVSSGLLHTSPARAGEIAGRIVNGTTQEAVVGVKVILLQGGSDTPTAETKSGREGRFRFEDVALGEYTLGAFYRDVPYAQRGIRVTDEAPRATLDLSVYETTTSDDDVSIRSNHLILQGSSEAINATEIVILENTGSRTFLGKLQPSSPTGHGFFLTLPPGYRELNTPDWLTRRIFNPAENGFHLAFPVPPGTTQFMLGYNLPRTIWGTPLDRRLSFPTGSFSVAVPLDQGLEVSAKALPEQRTVNIDGRKFLVMAGGPFAKEAPLEARIAGGLQAIGFSARQMGWIAGGLLTTGLGLGWVISRGRRLAS
ncbi:MAG: hypothetical protein Q8R92_08795 [Deltaproteobacteria bacterium]|nr:hypothetical protein [Deltaproteobacteria bacterium]